MTPNSQFSSSSDWLSLQYSKEALLSRMANRIRQSLDLQEILDATVIELRAFLQTDRTKVYRFDREGHGHVVAESSVKDRLPSLLGLHYPADDIPPQARALFVKARTRTIVDVPQQRIWLNSMPTPKSTSIQDLSVEAVLQRPIEETLSRPVDPCHVEYLTQMGVQSSLVVPILYQQDLWGLLISHHAEPREIAEADLQVVQLLTDQVSLAITQSSLLSQAQERAQREAIIGQIAALLHATRSPEQILQTVLEQAVKTSGSSGGRLYLTSPDGSVPTHLYTYGTQPSTTANPVSGLETHSLWQAARETSLDGDQLDPIAADEIGANATAFSQPAAAEQTVRVVVNLQQEPQLQPLLERFQHTAIRGLVIQPLSYGNEFLGCLTLFRDQIDTDTLWLGYEASDDRQQRPRQSMSQWQALKQDQALPWSLEEMELIQALNLHLSIAIMQNWLHQREQQQRLVLEMHNQQLTQAQAAAEEINRLKTNFLAMTSHELRTPLASTLNYLKLLKDQLYEDETELRQYIEGAYQSTRNLVTIINDVLDIAKIESRHVVVELESLLLPKLLQEQCFLVDAESRSQRTPLTLHCEVETVFADKIKVHQVMTNLLSNAFKFTPQGRVEVRATEDSTGTMAQISVSDSGIGIDMSNAEHLFEPFIQADRSPQRFYKGAGLGLAICRKLVELMGGRIWIESLGTGQGTTVSFTLPLHSPTGGQSLESSVG